MRDFYETLKKGTKSVVDRIFITGISPVMIDDLTSGFNIADNLTLELRYNNMMGFNRQEVDWLMDVTGVNRDYMIQVSSDFFINTSELDMSIRALALDGQAKPFVDYVSRYIFNKLSNRDLKKFDEKYIKIMLLGCLFQSNVYIPVSEIETNNGYVDIYLRRSPLVPEVKYEWIFELKYFKKTKNPSKNIGLMRKNSYTITAVQS